MSLSHASYAAGRGLLTSHDTEEDLESQRSSKLILWPSLKVTLGVSSGGRVENRMPVPLSQVHFDWPAQNSSLHMPTAKIQ